MGTRVREVHTRASSHSSSTTTSWKALTCPEAAVAMETACLELSPVLETGLCEWTLCSGSPCLWHHRWVRKKRNGSTWAADMPRWLTWPFTPDDVMSPDRRRWNQKKKELHDEAGISIRGWKMTKGPELIAIGDVNVDHCQPSSRRLSPLSSCFKSTSIHPKVKLIMTLKCLLITAAAPSSVPWPQDHWPAAKGGNQCSLTRTLQL